MPTFRDTISSKPLQRLFDYWDRIRGERAMPSRADIDPADIPDLLPYVALFDVEWEPLALRYRRDEKHVDPACGDGTIRRSGSYSICQPRMAAGARGVVPLAMT